MPITGIQYLILGIIQGITEWLPISSSGMTTLIMSNFYDITSISELLHAALFLHLGTFFAALIYLRKDVVGLFKTLFNYKNSKEENKKLFSFIFVSTLITAAIGLALLQLINISDLSLTGKAISFVVGFFLLITGIFQIKSRAKGLRKEKTLRKNDGIVLGFLQGLSTIPGLSRSGITVSGLLIKKFDDTSALRLSFLMSLPVVLFGNLLLNWNNLSITGTAIYGLLASFVFGLATIHGMMKIAKKINFGWFVFGFAILMMLAVLI